MLNSEGRKDMINENTHQRGRRSSNRKSNNGLVIGKSNEDISKQRKSTRSSGGDRHNNDNGKDGDGGDNDSNNTEYLTFERSQHEGEGEREQQQGYNSREY